MNKQTQEALKILWDAVERHRWAVSHDAQQSSWQSVCEAHDKAAETLEQPAQEPVELLEALSDLEHQQWIKWAKSIIDSEPISDARKQRWLTMMVDYQDLPDNIQEYDREWARKVMALTHPHQWQGLTDDEIEKVFMQSIKSSNGLFEYKNFARAIEQALRNKNHADNA